jgi:hypothetical protein
MEDKKKYEEVKLLLKELRPEISDYHREKLDELFPELAENEDKDARIRKNCIHFLELQKKHHAATFEIEECIDWLEKQGKQDSSYIYITQDIIDYINNRKAEFENNIPKLGERWKVKGIHNLSRNPIVELQNGQGEWMNLPLYVVNIQ